MLPMTKKSPPKRKSLKKKSNQKLSPRVPLKKKKRSRKPKMRLIWQQRTKKKRNLIKLLRRRLVKRKLAKVIFFFIHEIYFLDCFKFSNKLIIFSSKEAGSLNRTSVIWSRLLNRLFVNLDVLLN